MSNASAQDLFSEWLKSEIAPVLKSAGWTKSGNNFHLRGDGTVGVVQLAKSHQSRADHLWFWIKAGIWSERLSLIDAEVELWRQGQPSRPTPDECHLRIWYDTVMRPGWHWEMRPDSSTAELAALGRDVRDRLNRLVLPDLIAHMSDPALRDALLAGDERMSISGSALAYLYALINALGPSEALLGVVAQLQKNQPRLAERLGLA
jgi:hypothetical protein